MGTMLLRRPFAGLPSFRDEMDDLVHRFFAAEPLLQGSSSSFAPPLDVVENKDHVLVKAEIPGMKPEEIDISISGDTLTLRGEKKSERGEKSEGYVRQERVYGAFARTIKLPFPVSTDKTDASYENGVLEIRIARPEASKTQKVAVKGR